MKGNGRQLLSQGNGKLGGQIYHWSLPAGITCPGKSGLCSGCCYATKGRFLLPYVRTRLEENYQRSLEAGFAKAMSREIRRRWVQVCRVHVSGDYYSADYALKWLRVFRSCPRARFYCYTRSYRVQEIEPVLCEMALLRNVRLWYSADSEIGVPPRVPANIRVAWLQETEDDAFDNVDLVFRVRRLRRQSPAEVNGAMVCPSETPEGQVAEVTCATCRFCWK